MNPDSKNITIYTDGGSRGNPGPAAAAFAILDKNHQIIKAKGLFLGIATNNVAEYTALLASLKQAKELNAENINVFTDSELMKKQIAGQYKVKNKNLKEIYDQCIDLISKFEKFKITHVYRDKNKLADSLVNQAIDAQHDIESAPQKKTKINKQKQLKLGVLLSGGGTTLLNILDQIEKGNLYAQVKLVISSRPDVKGVTRAKNAGLNVKVITKKQFPDTEQLSNEIAKQLDAANVDLVILAGFLLLWKIPEKYENRVMNIHPALLPSFGGKGMWGHHVHKAVLERGCKISGCTVHFCTNEYDQGPIIAQRACPVEENDTPETLAHRVFEQECIAYPQAISLFAQNRLRVEGRKVKIKDA